MFDKIIVTRNTPDIGEAIGFLPGTEEEKMMPWLAAITDTLEALHKNDHCTEGSLKYICDKANIQFKSINFMRGRSIQNAFVLLDECRKLNRLTNKNHHHTMWRRYKNCVFGKFSAN